jgi:hypothetical protein
MQIEPTVEIRGFVLLQCMRKSIYLPSQPDYHLILNFLRAIEASFLIPREAAGRYP